MQGFTLWAPTAGQQHDTRDQCHGDDHEHNDHSKGRATERVLGLAGGLDHGLANWKNRVSIGWQWAEISL